MASSFVTLGTNLEVLLGMLRLCVIFLTGTNSIHLFLSLSVSIPSQATQHSVLLCKSMDTLLATVALFGQLLDNGFTKELKLFLSEMLQLFFNIVDLGVKLFDLVTVIVLVELLTVDNLGDKDELFGVRLSRVETQPGVLHHDHLTSFLLVTLGHRRAHEVSECLRDNRDQEIEKQDNVEDSAEEEDEPVTLSVVSKFISELTKGSQE